MQRYISLYLPELEYSEAARLLRASFRTFIFGPVQTSEKRSAFEAEWCRAFGAREAVAFGAARSGLYHLLQSLQIQPGDEVVVQGFTCMAVIVPIVACGAVPVYADLASQSYNTDAATIEHLISPRTKVVIVQHTFGIPGPIQALVPVARKRGITLVEDCALALGAKLDGQFLGSFGNAAIFSFELSKTLSVGWGGLVQVNRSGIAESLRTSRDSAGRLGRVPAARRLLQGGLSRALYHPTTPSAVRHGLALLFKIGLFQPSTTADEHHGVLPRGYLAAPAEEQWDVLQQQLRRLTDVVEHSRRVAERYLEALRGHGRTTHRWPGGGEPPTLIRFPLQVKEPARASDFFARRGIELGRWFSHPVSPDRADWAIARYSDAQCPVAEEVSRHIVNLPLHRRLSSSDIEHICATLHAYFCAYPEEAQFDGCNDKPTT